MYTNQEQQRLEYIRGILRQHETTAADVMDGFLIIVSDPSATSVAAAMMAHYRDWLREQPKASELDYQEAIAQIYWRTFCSKTHADLYGTGDIAADTEGSWQLLMRILDEFDMTKAATGDEITLEQLELLRHPQGNA